MRDVNQDAPESGEKDYCLQAWDESPWNLNSRQTIKATNRGFNISSAQTDHQSQVTDDSKAKIELLNAEFGRFQAYLQRRKDVDLYSATKQQADRLKAKIEKHHGTLNPKKQYPLILRRDLIDLRKDSKFPCIYWMKVPVYPKSIHLRIQRLIADMT